jgi:aspartokinase
MMIKIPDSIRDIVTGNHFLQFGLSYRLFNLTQLAKYIQPLVETRCQKSVQSTAIVTALGRLQKNMMSEAPSEKKFTVDNISVKSGLATRTFYNRPEVRTAIHRLAEDVHKRQLFYQYTETTHEISLFYERSMSDTINKELSFETKYSNDRVACVGISFSEELFEQPGLLYVLMQRITLQNINLIDISSTFTEFNFFVRDEDVKIVFETLHDCFL